MNWIDRIREVGMDILWEDAGWSASRLWYHANYEGPDFSHTVRYLHKNDMKLCVWYAGYPHWGNLASKAAAWGDFQWRTDGITFTANQDRIFKKQCRSTSQK